MQRINYYPMDALVLGKQMQKAVNTFVYNVLVTNNLREFNEVDYDSMVDLVEHDHEIILWDDVEVPYIIHAEAVPLPSRRSCDVGC